MSGNFYYTIELIIIIGVIAYQFFLSFNVLINIKIFEKIFQSPLRLDDKPKEAQKGENPDITEEKYPQLSCKGKNDVMIRARDAINSYLKNNFGAALNFSIVKDIIDREVETLDEEINQNISIPLYLGLAAAMTGIIFGLLAMPDMSSTAFNEGIDALIRGVRAAMIASLIGLLLTTILTSGFYKNAKSKVLKDKNDQLSYLQAKLLPVLVKSDETSYPVLIESINNATRLLTRNIDVLNEIARSTGENLRIQNNTLQKIEKMNVTRVSKTNLELFNKLENNMESFEKFREFLTYMGEISANLKEFGSRTSNIDLLVSRIEENINESGTLVNFLSSHLEKIENSSNTALSSINIMESYFAEALRNLQEEISERMEFLRSNANNHESQLTSIYNEIGVKLDLLIQKHIKTFQLSYENAVPQFKQLDHLEMLPGFKSDMNEKFDAAMSISSQNATNAIEEITKLKDSVNRISNRVDKDELLKKLNTIENSLVKSLSRAKPINNGSPKTGKEDNNGSPKSKSGIVERSKKFFRGILVKTKKFYEQ